MAPELGRDQYSDRHSSGVIGKAFALLTVLRSTSGTMRLSDLSRKTGLPKSTTHRLLSDLLASDAVIRVGTDYKAARHSDNDLAGSYRTLQRKLAPYLGDVLIRTGLTASLAVLDETEVVHLQTVHGHDDTWGAIDDSGRGCAYTTAAGRVLMAFDRAATRRVVATSRLNPGDAANLHRDLVRIRRDRFAMMRTDQGTTCIAVPLLGALGHPRVALTVKGRSERIRPERVVYWLHRVADEATREILPCVPARAIA
jgi:DNA-binding IclR family transcriptional regulator